MAYNKKVWENRQTEYPGRRKLTAVAGSADTYDVTRQEGLELAAGDALNAENLNGLEERIAAGIQAAQVAADQKATKLSLLVTLPVAGWSAAAPFTQTVSVAGALATDAPVADVVLSETAATAMAQLESWGLVGRIKTAAGGVTAICYTDKPTTDIPIQMLIVR